LNILAFDTATTATAAALVAGDAARELRDDPATGAHPGHATRLLPMADELLSQAGIGWDELDLIAVGTGPGGFTGLRVGVATARGVAVSLGLVLAGRSSLAALARAALHETGAPRALALIDARRGEVFAQQFELEDGQPRELSAARALAPDDLGAPSAGTVVVGDGLLRHRETVDVGAALVPDADSTLHRVQAAQLAAMATYGLLPSQVVPEYVREPDATAAIR
jgi:tRNA threonylcarbamoyladenosine biosynthesis protein TsaB